MSPTYTVTVPQQCQVTTFPPAGGDPGWTTPVVFGISLIIVIAFIAVGTWVAHR